MNILLFIIYNNRDKPFKLFNPVESIVKEKETHKFISKRSKKRSNKRSKKRSNKK